jgi:hypothetical protein
MKLSEVSIQLPEGWRLHQQAKDGVTELLGFENGEHYLQFYVRSKKSVASGNMYELADAKVVKQYVYPVQTALQWTLTETLKETVPASLGSAETPQFSYLIIASGGTAVEITQNLREFITGIQTLTPKTRSLTGPDYTGKKYYLGFGDYLSGFMGNEVKYDIAHTHDIFTKEIGGSYIGKKVLGSQVGYEELMQKWQELKEVMTEKDMYVQYSSGHGSHTGLEFGPSYNQIRDNALSYPAKEIIIFTMACYSGNLVNSFNQKKQVWQDWQSQGKTLMVMSSSRADETSSTGPIHDDAEPNGPSGSAGSAFGHALWKALVGNADGAVDGIKDHFLSLAEIRDYTIKKTIQVGEHTPIVTGAYNGNLLMVKVPSQESLADLTGGTEGLSEDQIMEKIRQLDAEWRLN